jgi:hypothetical protein
MALKSACAGNVADILANHRFEYLSDADRKQDHIFSKGLSPKGFKVMPIYYGT